MDCRFVTKHEVRSIRRHTKLCICLSSYTVKLPIKALLHGDYLNYNQCSVVFYLVMIALFDRLFMLLTPKIWFPLLGVFNIRPLLHWMHYCLSPINTLDCGLIVDPFCDYCCMYIYLFGTNKFELSLQYTAWPRVAEKGRWG